jgi:hypothetical protein
LELGFTVSFNWKLYLEIVRTTSAGSSFKRVEIFEYIHEWFFPVLRSHLYFLGFQREKFASIFAG